MPWVLEVGMLTLFMKVNETWTTLDVKKFHPLTLPFPLMLSSLCLCLYRLPYLSLPSIRAPCCPSLNLRCAGFFSEEDAPSRRLAKPLLFCRCESECSLDNGYARPIEGILIVVDMQVRAREAGRGWVHSKAVVQCTVAKRTTW